MKGDHRKYMSRAFDKSVQSQREAAAHEVNAFLKRERWPEKLLGMEWRIVPETDPIGKGLSRIQITGIEK